MIPKKALLISLLVCSGFLFVAAQASALPICSNVCNCQASCHRTCIEFPGALPTQCGTVGECRGGVFCRAAYSGSTASSALDFLSEDCAVVDQLEAAGEALGRTEVAKSAAAALTALTEASQVLSAASDSPQGWSTPMRGACATSPSCADINAGNFRESFCPSRCKLNAAGDCGFCTRFRGTCTCTL